MTRLRICAVSCLYIAVLLAIADRASANPLPALGADASKTSVSGLSSGAYMAGQFHVARSKSVIGAGIIAGGPFGCAQSTAAETFPVFSFALGYNVAQALQGCMENRLSALGVLDAKRLVNRAKRLERSGAIDPLDRLAATKVFIHTGKNDGTVAPAIAAAARDFYREAGLPEKSIFFSNTQPGGHGFPTVATGSTCELTKPPYVNNCGTDKAGEILEFIYGRLNPRGTAVPAHFAPFDQRPYLQSGSMMSATGVVYTPAACRDQAGCAIHVLFHGCSQSISKAGDILVRGSGMAEWAETNRLIVLFPQVDASSYNPRGCWDWWGYTGSKYLTRDAPQIKAISRMIDRLTEPARSSSR